MFHQYSDADKAEKEQEYDLHVRRKNAAREEKNKDTAAAINPKIVTATFDLEAELYSPFVPTKRLFYKRKLASFNFTVFVVKKKQGYCYMWPEHFGKRGSQQIATCLAKFIDEEVANAVKKLNLFADNCGGQNKNRLVVAMLGDALQAHPSLNEINLKFLEPGHTYMECDTMHSTIERASRQRNIYVPNDWVKIARHAKQTGHQYSVHAMQHRDFLNYQTLRKIFPTNLKFTDGEKMSWRACKWIQLRRKQPRSIFVKNEYWESFKEVVLRRSFKSDRKMEQLYEQPLPIPRSKYNDLMSLCKSRVIPERYHTFYTDLPVDNNDVDQNDNDNDGHAFDGRARVPKRCRR